MVGKFQKERQMIFDNNRLAMDVKQKILELGITRKNYRDTIGVSPSMVDKLVKYNFQTPNISTFLIIINWLGTEPNRYFK